MNLKILLMVAALWSAVAAAAPPVVSFEFAEMRLSDLARIVWVESLKKSLVLDDALLGDARTVALDLRGFTIDQLERAAVEVFNAYGYEVHRDAVVRFSKRPETEQESELFIYRPKYRAPSYLQGVAEPFVKGRWGGSQANAQAGGAVAFPVDARQDVAFDVSGSSAKATSTASRGLGSVSRTSAVRRQAESEVVVFQGTKAEVATVTKLIHELDTMPGELVVKAHVYEVGRDRAEADSVGLVVSVLGDRLGIEINSASEPKAGGAIKIKAGSVSAVYRALSGDSRFRVVSSPSVRVQSGAKARLVVGTETPVLGSVTSDRGGNAVQSVEYRPAGVILQVEPIEREGGIELQLDQQVSSFGSTSTGVTGSPTLMQRALSTVLRVQSGEVVVLGGLQTERKTDEESGFRWLPDFLRTRQKDEAESDLVIVLQVEKT